MYYNPKVINGDNEAILCCADYIDIPEGAQIKMADIIFAMRDKLTDLIEDYIKDSEEVGQDGLSNVSLLIRDFLVVEPNVYNIDTIVSGIMDSPQAVSFIDSKTVSLRNLSQGSFLPITQNQASKADKGFMQVHSAKLNDISLASFLQVLSQINY